MKDGEYGVHTHFLIVFMRIVLRTCRERGRGGGESQEVAVSYV